MARLGPHSEAHDLLASIYGGFTEGFDTADLNDARLTRGHERKIFRLGSIESARGRIAVKVTSRVVV
jgi:hypothetical protein